MTQVVVLFVKCLALGFSIAMILGPIAVLCIQQTLTNGFAAGFAVGLGVATADGIFAVVAGLGLSFVAHFLIGQQFWLQLIGGAFLCYLGIRTLLNNLQAPAIILTSHHLRTLYGSTLLLTLTNPLTLISFSALLAGVNIINPGIPSLLYAALLFCSFFIGSAVWWLILSGSLSMFRTKITPAFIQRINTIAGTLLIAFGSAAIINSFTAIIRL